MKKKLSGLLAGVICLSLTGVAFALTPKEKLGKRIYEDPAFSAGGNQSCQSCHDPKAQFSDPVNRISPLYRPVSQGSDGFSFGGRNAPPAAYAAFSPPLHWDDADGLFIGGLFWDGRANTLAEQAMGPPLNPLEMANPDTETIAGKLRAAGYAPLFSDVYGAGALDSADKAFEP